MPVFFVLGAHLSLKFSATQLVVLIELSNMRMH